MSDSANSTLELARGLRDLADGLNEAELRNALSRSYYSIYHAARVLAKAGQYKKIAQGNIVEVMSEVDAQLGASIRALRDLRHKADYDETYVQREFGGDIRQFRDEVRQRLDDGAVVFQRILVEIEQRQKAGKE